MTPSEVLFDGIVPKTIPVCDHYCGTEARMKKALALQQEMGPSFDITFDLEDGAPIGQELSHAKLVCQLIASENNQFNRIGVRVHDPKSPHFINDVKRIVHEVGNQVAYIVFPKIETASQTVELIEQINEHADQLDCIRNIPIHVLIETHLALANVFDIAAITQVESLSFGLMDFVSAHYGAIPSSAMSVDQFKHPLVDRAMREISAACHTFDKTPSHNVCVNIHSPEVVTNESLMAKNLYGYTRKWSIHPNQIPLIVNAFSPTDHEIEDAISIIDAAMKANWGPIQHNGKLHDRASYRYYWMMIQKAKISNHKRIQTIETNGWFQ